MNYDISFKKRDELLEVEINGYRNSEKSRAKWDEIASECKKHSIKKLLVISKLKGKLSAADAFLGAEYMAQKFRGIVSKVAYVDLNSSSYSVNLFSEEVASNRGIKGKVFNNIKEAEDYISE